MRGEKLPLPPAATVPLTPRCARPKTSARVPGAVLPKPSKTPRRPMSRHVGREGVLELDVADIKPRARLAEPPARDVGPVVVRVSEVILRLHLDQRAPHALHDEQDAHKLPIR